MQAETAAATLAAEYDRLTAAGETSACSGETHWRSACFPFSFYSPLPLPPPVPPAPPKFRQGVAYVTLKSDLDALKVLRATRDEPKRPCRITAKRAAKTVASGGDGDGGDGDGSGEGAERTAYTLQVSGPLRSSTAFTPLRSQLPYLKRTAFCLSSSALPSFHLISLPLTSTSASSSPPFHPR